MKKLSVLDWIALIIVIIGALNWGLIALLNVDLVEHLLGYMTVPAIVIYSIVGLSGLYTIYLAKTLGKK